VQQEFDVKKTYQRIDTLYRQAILERKGLRTIPVIMYHKITDAPLTNSKHGTWVTKQKFVQQLASLKRRGFTTITFQDCLSYSSGQKVIPRKPIILTFDDGYEDNYTNAFPLLKQFGMTGVIFLVVNPQITNNVWDVRDGEPSASLLNREEILEMADYGIEFGSHTSNHVKLADVPQDVARNELYESKQTLEAMLGEPVLSICYPYGVVNEAVKQLAEDVGYPFGIASDSGPMRFGDDLFEIRRAQIFPHTSMFGFWKKTSSWYLRYKQFKLNLKYQKSSRQVGTK
jgi:peptidoglycan/xylan/chitin deacetylase (PgdA/CDA1 family)